MDRALPVFPRLSLQFGIDFVGSSVRAFQKSPVVNRLVDFHLVAHIESVGIRITTAVQNIKSRPKREFLPVSSRDPTKGVTAPDGIILNVNRLEFSFSRGFPFSDGGGRCSGTAGHPEENYSREY